VESTQKDSEMTIEAIFDSAVRALRAGERVENALVEVRGKRVPY